ncbi:MAG: PaaI family thioesterase [Acidimicrobiia bacterium]
MTDEPKYFAMGCEFFDQLPHRHVEVDGEFGVEIDVSDDMRGPAGSVHGGLVSMLVDVAGASSLARATGRPVATASTSIQYLAAGRVGPLRATGTVLRTSEALGVVDVKVIDAGRDDRLLAAAHVTLRFLSGDGYVRQT